MKYILIYFLIMNFYSLCLTVYDKRRAVKGGSRIPEKRLFAAAILGGSPAMYAAMRLIRHKTLHKRFMIGLPLIMGAQSAAIAGVVYLKYHNIL
ncbi:MAG: DUF1294 domain-containing protein [Ruminococcus sp.]|nr:DUF1294 domain-containing protein [Ruminococcus sp.]